MQAVATAAIVAMPGVAEGQGGDATGWRLEGGYGPSNVSCGRCVVARSRSLAAYVEVAARVDRQLDVGLRVVDAWAADSGFSMALWHALVVARVRPIRSAGFYFELGTGANRLGSLFTSDADDLSTRRSDGSCNTGSAGSSSYTGRSRRRPEFVGYGGIGYELDVGRHMSISPFVNFTTSFGQTITSSTIDDRPASTTRLLHMGIAVAFR